VRTAITIKIQCVISNFNDFVGHKKISNLPKSSVLDCSNRFTSHACYNPFIGESKMS